MKWLLKVSLTTLLVSTLTIVTTGFVVNAYIQSVLSSFNIQLETESMGVGGMMKAMLGIGSGSKQDSVNAAKESGQTENKGSTAKDSISGAGKDANAGQTEDDEPSTKPSETTVESPENETPDNSLPVMSMNTTESGNSSLEDQEIVMTPGDIVDRKGSLSTEDKEEIFTILMNKLPQSEMQKISEAMEDGLTAAELEEIEQGISKYLNPEEFDKLISMLKD
ncbi:hypothetical protein ABEQ74_08415 [Paenibacillus solani]